ncbi:serine protease [Georgenia subflava]|uniref:Serine protease n=1 Tax=Georgenia subflava TaxID=1622177 RepID=A0A6N7EE41_9MICO|nr:serine protease [Georgenia subflava]MPV36379.1 hypothetical protein [Georgenia subflava]
MRAPEELSRSWPETARALEVALEERDEDGAARLVGALVARLDGAEDAGTAPEALDLLELLRRHRRLALVERLAEALLRTDAPPPAVHRHYAQALIERGALSAAVAVLDELVRGSDPAEVAEARGLLGRAHKEIFLTLASPLRRRAALERALEAYGSVYRADPTRLWHGTNTAALLLRAAREACPVAGVDDPQAAGLAIAADVAGRVAAGGGGSWAWAIGIESAVALGRIDDALALLRDQAQDAGAFALASLRRQLVRVWELRPDSPPGSLLLPPLEALLLTKQGAELSLTAAAPTSGAGFEKVFGAEGAQTQAWFEDLLRRCRAVARIDGPYARPVGTGFLLRGADLHPALPAVVLVTNAHVVPDAVAPEDAVVTFLGLGTPLPGLVVRRLLWSSPAGKLDTAVLEIDPPSGVDVNPVATRMPPLGASPPSRVYVVGHPMGSGAVRVTIRDNDLLDHDDTMVHYRAPTEPGSSGSPVFDDRWRVLAVHHRGLDAMPRLHGSGVYPANEGVQLGRIRADMAAELPRGEG